jgi:ribonuclease E
VGKRVTTPVGRAKVLSVNTLKQLVRLRFDETGEVVEMGAEELRQQYGTAVRPEELEPTVEEPRRRRERSIQESTIAILQPVTERVPSPAVAAQAESPVGDTDDGDAVDADGAPRRRRRGRRGGRRRRRPGEAGEGTAPAAD